MCEARPNQRPSTLPGPVVGEGVFVGGLGGHVFPGGAFCRRGFLVAPV